MDSRIVLVQDHLGSRLGTAWLRTLRTSGQTVYSGWYGAVTLPGSEGPTLRVVFPLPNGSVTVFLRPEVRADGGLVLRSPVGPFGAVGAYLIVSEPNHTSGWVRRVPLSEQFVALERAGSHEQYLAAIDQSRDQLSDDRSFGWIMRESCVPITILPSSCLAEDFSSPQDSGRVSFGIGSNGSVSTRRRHEQPHLPAYAGSGTPSGALVWAEGPQDNRTAESRDSLIGEAGERHLAGPRLEPEASQPARLGAQCHGHRMGLDAIDVPRGWSLRRRVERGGDTCLGLIEFGRPPLVRPSPGEARERGRVSLPFCFTFGDDVSIEDRDSDRAARPCGLRCGTSEYPIRSGTRSFRRARAHRPQSREGSRPGSPSKATSCARCGRLEPAAIRHRAFRGRSPSSPGAARPSHPS